MSTHSIRNRPTHDNVLLLIITHGCPGRGGPGHHQHPRGRGCLDGADDGAMESITRAPGAYLPWISRPSGLSGVTGMNS
jgi:hypothetical protein